MPSVRVLWVIVVVTGTGTEIGKTHLACALVGALVDLGARALAWKPVESGVTGAHGDDEGRLAEAAGTTAGVPTLRLRAPLSPHLAARREGVVIDEAQLRARLHTLATRAPIVVLELAGGLFSPLDDALDNADWLVRSGLPLTLLLAAPDRLGVLHDVGATLRAARALGLPCDTVALVAPAHPDASTGTNACELAARAVDLAVVSIPRAPVDALRRHPSIVELARSYLTSETAAARSPG